MEYRCTICMEKMGNTRDSVEGCIKACVAVFDFSTIKKFNQSNDAKFYRNQIKDRIQ